MKGDIAQLGFVTPNKSLYRSSRKEGSLNLPQQGASLCDNITEFQEVSVLDQTLLLGITMASVFLRLHH